MPNQTHRSRTFRYLRRAKSPKTAAEIARATGQQIDSVRAQLVQLKTNSRVKAEGSPMRFEAIR